MRAIFVVSCLLTGVLAACGPGGGDDGDSLRELARVSLQTDWYPQPEHGGFYQALARGFYREEGLDVEILPGGMQFMGAVKVTQGRVDFAMHKADSILVHIQEGMPLRMVMATFQHDPQGILIHASNPISSFPELDGATVMAMPGATWIEFLERKYGIQLRILPHDKGMTRFLADEGFLQQCMVTNEPFFAEQQGRPAKVLLLSESGYDPYHVVYARRDFAEAHPDLVRGFVRASLRGWKDYLEGDPTPAHEEILRRNPAMTQELMAFGRRAIRERGLFGGEEAGRIDPRRLESIQAILLDLGLLEAPLALEELVDPAAQALP